MTRPSTDEILRSAGRAIQGDAPFEDFVTMLDDEHKRALAWALLKIDCGQDESRFTKATDMHWVLGMLGHKCVKVFPVNRTHHLVTTCDNEECMVCGRAVCPGGSEMHFHHDGCPSPACGPGFDD